MKERAFNGRPDEVRAILAGATVIRRLLRVQPDPDVVTFDRRGLRWRSRTADRNVVIGGKEMTVAWVDCFGLRSPFGAPGDRLWIREAWAPVPTPGGYGCAPDACEREAMLIYRADGARPDLRWWSDGGPRWDGRWRSASAMPRWASRLVLEVASVDVEKGPEGWAWVVNFRRVA